MHVYYTHYASSSRKGVVSALNHHTCIRYTQDDTNDDEAGDSRGIPGWDKVDDLA